MSWPASIFSALLTGVLGLFVAGFIASLTVDWYHISPREGGAGYFVVFMGLLGFAAGLVLGLIIARAIAGGAHPGFFRGLGVSFAVVCGIGLLVGGVARALADVPPKIGGETLLLAVEIRWPAEQQARPAALGADEPSVGLHSIPHFSHTVRASESGPLWIEDAHLVDGRWVVPGAVEIFTSRGTRMMSVNTGGETTQGFQVPLPAFPGKKSLEWSDWLPRFRPGVTPPPDLLSFRFRALPAGQPVRVEAIGPFEVLTSAYGFFPVQREKRRLFGTSATFGLRYRGRPVVLEAKTNDAGDPTVRSDRIDEVALVGGPRPALLVHADPPDGSGHCYLVSEEAERARVEQVDVCGSGMTGQVLTADSSLFHAADAEPPVRGRIDRSSFARPGLYRIANSVLDSRSLVVRHYTPDSTAYDIPSVPPLTLSPDERSFVTYARPNETEAEPVLLVTDIVANRTYSLPIDPARMHYARFESLDPAWVDHHFEWRRGQDGVDHLVERAHFVPLAWRGEVSVYSDGQSTYRLEKATEGLRGVLIDFLVKEFKGVRQPADSDAYEIPVAIGAQTVKVAFSTSADSPYVAISGAPGSADSALVAGIAQRFNALLATGRFDNLFGK